MTPLFYHLSDKFHSKHRIANQQRYGRHTEKLDAIFGEGNWREMPAEEENRLRTHHDINKPLGKRNTIIIRLMLVQHCATPY